MKVSLSGYDVFECRRQFLAFIVNEFETDDSWREHCLRYWLLELGGLAAVW